MADLAFFEGRQTTQVPTAHDTTGSLKIRTLAMSLDCNPVGQITVTPIVQDMNIGDYVREVRIFTAPAGNAEPELLLLVRLHALTSKQLEIMTPAHVI